MGNAVPDVVATVRRRDL